jgi:hypothetical protein
MGIGKEAVLLFGLSIIYLEPLPNFKTIRFSGGKERNNEPSGSIKGVEFLNWISDYQLLKRESAV